MVRPDLAADPRFETNQLRTEHRSELIAILQEEMAKKTTKEWIERYMAEAEARSSGRNRPGGGAS